MEKWKTRKELPVCKKLEHLKFDSRKLLEAYKEFTTGKIWDGLGAEYSSLCETYTHLPQMFFTKDELESVDSVCDIDWQKASYQQFSLVKFDESYSLDQRVEKSNTKWDTKIAKNLPYADERFFRARVSGLPSYFDEVLDAFDGKAHRARFAKLAPKSKIKPHIDYNTEYGIRVHIPIITNEKCFNGGKDPVTNEEVITHFDADGSTYFINPGVLHWAVNDGAEERVHLIISVDSQEILNG